jgi:hypothetical protein
MRLDALTQPGWEDVAVYFCERDMTYRTAKLIVVAIL